MAMFVLSLATVHYITRNIVLKREHDLSSMDSLEAEPVW